MTTDNSVASHTALSLSDCGEGALLTPCLLDSPAELSESSALHVGNSSVADVSVQSKLSSYVQYANLEISKEPEIRSDLDKVCSSGLDRIIINDSFCEFLHPSVGYLDLLGHLGYKRSSGLGELFGYRPYLCENTGTEVLYPVVDAEMFNPWYPVKKIRNSVSRTMQKLCSLTVGYLVFFELTYPYPISQAYLTDRVGVAAKCLEAFALFFGKLESLKGGQLGCAMNFHIWKSKAPLEPHLHHHINLLGGVVKDGVLRRLPMQSAGKPIHVSVLKALWFVSLQEVFGVGYLNSADGVALTPEEINVYIRWRPLDDENRGFIAHRVKYMKRSPLTDLVTFYEKNDFDAGRVNRAFVDELLHYKNSTRTYGFWRRLKTYCSGKSEVPERVCPSCGGGMVYRGRMYLCSEVLDVPVVTLLRGGFYKIMPPPGEV